MYQDHFKLNRAPFRLSTDPDRYFPSSGHEATLAELRDALAGGEAIALIDGDPGVGKTLLGAVLLKSIPETTATAFLTNSHFATRSDLIAGVLADFGARPERDGEAGLRQDLTEYCLENYSHGSRCVVVVDEAHLLTGDLLEELRMWGNLAGTQGPAIQVVLVAQPELRARLRSGGFGSLHQRAATRVRLEPLSPQESVEFIINELKDVGARAEALLTREALALMSRSGGVPRVLCQLANKAFALTAASGGQQVDAEAVLEAASRLELQIPDEDAAEVPRVLPLPEAKTERKPARRRREPKKAAGHGE